MTDQANDMFEQDYGVLNEPGVRFPFGAKLDRLFDTSSLSRKSLLSEPTLPVSSHLDMLINACMRSLNGNSNILNGRGELVSFIAGALSSDYQVTCPDKANKPGELQFETNHEVKVKTKLDGGGDKAKTKRLTFTFTRNFDLALDYKEFDAKKQELKKKDDVESNHREIIGYFDKSSKRWKIHFC